jgi:hypothetical protein
MEVFKVQGVIDLKDNLTSKIGSVKNKVEEVENKIIDIENRFVRLGSAIDKAFSSSKIDDFKGQIAETTAKIQTMDTQLDNAFKGAEGEKAISGMDKETKKLTASNDKLKNKMGEVETKTGTMKSGFMKLGGILAGVFAVSKVIDFGKQVIETTAKIQAMDSQFEQVFKGAEGEQALDGINKQAGELGIHGDRLKGAWSSFGAQLKGVGMDGSEAIEATSLATRLAADSAAFYDTSLETAQGSIASFMKGNFAAGDAIGVFTNAKQMDGKAMDKYGKKWQELSEEERQYLLLETVEKTYELNGAMGQAVREQDSWANVTGNLKAVWERFLSVVGAPVLKVAIKVVKGIVDGIGKLQDKMKGFKFTFFDDMKLNLEFLKDGIKGIGDPEALTGISSIFYKIGQVIKKVVDFVQDVLVPIFMDLWEMFKTYLPYIQDIFGIAFDAINTVFDAVVEIVKEVVVPIFEDLKNWFVENFPKIRKAVTDAWDKIKPSFDKLVEAVKDFVIPVIKDLWDRVKEAMPTIQAIFEKVWDAVVVAVQLAIDIITAIVKKAGEIYETIKPYLDNVQSIFETVFGAVGVVIGAVTDAIQWAIDKLKEWNDMKVKDKNKEIANSTPSSKAGAKGGMTNGTSSSNKGKGGGSSFDVGSRYIPFDMMATVHKGEMIIPESENPYANSNGRILPQSLNDGYANKGNAQGAKAVTVINNITVQKMDSNRDIDDISDKLGNRTYEKLFAMGLA